MAGERALPRDACIARRAEVAAHATVGWIRLLVDARLTALLGAAAAARCAFASRANFALLARNATVATVGAVGGRVDAAAATLGRPTAAARRALAGRANFALLTRSATGPAVGGIARDHGASRAANLSAITAVESSLDRVVDDDWSAAGARREPENAGERRDAKSHT